MAIVGRLTAAETLVWIGSVSVCGVVVVVVVECLQQCTPACIAGCHFAASVALHAIQTSGQRTISAAE